MKKFGVSTFVFCMLFSLAVRTEAQSTSQWTIEKLPDTGQVSDFTQTVGEDGDYGIYPPSYTDNGDGTVTDHVTGLMWQKQDGGEMTWEDAVSYSESLSLAGYDDWRLPTNVELFSIHDYSQSNPALDATYFTKTDADYWWSGTISSHESSRVWVTNGGGGIGDHPKQETVSAGGSRRFHARCVRMINPENITDRVLQNNSDGTVTDLNTGLIWQEEADTATTWDDALTYSEALELAGYNDWRLPNIKELHSISNAGYVNPAMDTTVFTDALSEAFWSSTSLSNQPSEAWVIEFNSGIVTHYSKTNQAYVRSVRGEAGLSQSPGEPSYVQEWFLY
jgi:hypothetical protein